MSDPTMCDPGEHTYGWHSDSHYYCECGFQMGEVTDTDGLVTAAADARYEDGYRSGHREGYMAAGGRDYGPDALGDLKSRPAYRREVLVEVLIYHWRRSISACGCGWSVLGASHAGHVADVYEASAAALEGHARG